MARWGVREAVGRYMYEIVKVQKFKRQGKCIVVVYWVLSLRMHK